MKIVADQDIPFVEHYFASAGDLVLFPGRELKKKYLHDADILLVRSITKVNQSLLEGTKVRCVASPTTGMDHFDVDWLNAANIRWIHAPGCNALSVEQYILCVIAALQKKGYLKEKNLRAGVVGVGNIGRLVVEKLKMLGFDVVQCDPFLENIPHQPLASFENLDLITLHTPLTYSGEYPTYHMINRNFLEKQKKNTVLINTSRGAVIDFNDLKLYGQSLLWCLDVWEHEPVIDVEVLETAMIATPHIAGYTVQSRQRSTEMMYRALVQEKIIPDKAVQPVFFPSPVLSFDHDWREPVLKIYDPLVTTQLMKQKIMENPLTAFDDMRRGFVDRNEFKM